MRLAVIIDLALGKMLEYGWRRLDKISFEQTPGFRLDGSRLAVLCLHRYRQLTLLNMEQTGQETASLPDSASPELPASTSGHATGTTDDVDAAPAQDTMIGIKIMIGTDLWVIDICLSSTVAELYHAVFGYALCSTVVAAEPCGFVNLQNLRGAQGLEVL